MSYGTSPNGGEASSDCPAVIRNLLGRQAGVGITEVLIALVIFSTAILGIVGTAAHVGGIVNASHVRLAVGTVARAQVEALMATPYDSITDGTAVDRGVQMGWTVTETGTVKDILFVYQYDLPNGAHHDTLTVACLKP